MTDDNEALARLGPAFLDGYAVVDLDRRISSINNALGQMLELRPADRKKLIKALCCEHLRLEVCKDKCIAEECMNKNTPMRMQEIHARTPDGREFVLELSTMPLKNAKGEVGGALIVYRDVTDERRLKTRFMEDQADHRRQRSELLKIIEDRDAALSKLRGE